MEKEFTKEQQYILARKRVKKISKFYKHLAIYVAVNIFLTAIFIAGDMNDKVTFIEAFTDYHNYVIWLYWGFGIAFQALNTFALNVFINKDWEKKKITKYMDEQNNRSF